MTEIQEKREIWGYIMNSPARVVSFLAASTWIFLETRDFLQRESVMGLSLLFLARFSATEILWLRLSVLFRFLDEGSPGVTGNLRS